MRVKVTPLNIILAAVFTATLYFILFPHEKGWHLPGAVALFMFCVICFITDLIFRYFIKDLKRIWIVELVFIIFATILTILIKKI